MPVVARRFRPEISEAEPAGELLAGIVAVPAPAAGRIGAGGIPEPAYQPPRLRELMAHPGRHDRVAAGHRQPGQRVGQRPAGIRRLTHDLTGVSGAGDALQPPAYRRACLGVRRASRAAKPGEEIVECAACAFRLRRGQPMPRCQQAGIGLPQRFQFVAEDLQRKTGVELRVVHPPALEPTVLVVFDEVVIGIAGKGERAEHQGVQGRELQQPQTGIGRREVGQVEGDQVVAQHEGRPIGESRPAWPGPRADRRRNAPGAGRYPARTAPKAWMRPSSLPTSRSSERQRSEMVALSASGAALRLWIVARSRLHAGRQAVGRRRVVVLVLDLRVSQGGSPGVRYRPKR